MSAPEFEMAVNTLLLKIHVITGWTIPADEIMLLFIDQFKKKAIESYPLVNADEVEYAFRQYGVGVKDWGKSMNLSLIDEVMQPYLESRSELSQFEERVMKPTAELPPSKMADEEMMEWISEMAEKYKSGVYSKSMLPTLMYDFLNERNLIGSDKKEVLDKARKSRLAHWQNLMAYDPRTAKESKEAVEFLISDTIDKAHPEYNNLITEAKRICLIDYFNSIAP